MITLLKIMIWGKWILLTSLPIQIDSTPYKITPEKPLSAVTAGAHIRLDISQIFPKKDMNETFDKVDQEFPPECIKVILFDADGHSISMGNQGTSISNKEVHLQFFAQGGLDTEKNYTSVELSSCKKLNNVKVIWANYYQ